MLEELSDDYLICLWREKHQLAIETLYERYTKFIYGIIIGVQRRKGGYLDFEDCFQEGFLVLLNCLERYDGENGNFYFFVKTSIEKKLYSNFVKDKKNKDYISLDKFVYEEGEETLSDYVSEDDNNGYIDFSIYEKAISKMDDACRKIVDLRLAGYSYRDIANMLGITKQNVYRQVSKIKNIIKDVIEKID